MNYHVESLVFHAVVVAKSPKNDQKMSLVVGSCLISKYFLFFGVSRISGFLVLLFGQLFLTYYYFLSLSLVFPRLRTKEDTVSLPPA